MLKKCCWWFIVKHFKRHLALLYSESIRISSGWAMGLIEDIMQLPNELLKLIAPSDPPFSSVFIGLVSIGLAFFSTYVIWRFTDVEKLQRYSEIMQEYMQLQKQVLKTADKKLKLKLEREQPRYQRIQSELFSMRMKPLMIMIIPMLLFFVILGGYYNGVTGIAAYVPFDLPERLLFFQIGKWHSEERIFEMSFVWFYFGFSAAFGGIFRKIFRLDV